jgi:hypothetical protein
VVLLARIELAEHLKTDDRYLSFNLEENLRIDLIWPEERGFYSELNTVKNESYIYLELSKHDSYDVRFTNSVSGEADHMVIASTEWAWFEIDLMRPILQKIPSHITQMGYDQILIRPLDGDAEYAIRNVNLYSEIPEFDHFVNVMDVEIKQLEIFMDEADYLVLIGKREEAIQLNVLLSDEDSEVPATFISEGKLTEGSLRLKGDWTDHLVFDKWSFRIDLKSNDSIYSMTEFSIQDPITRLGYNEVLIYDFYQSVGGVSIRYEFIDVFVNGIYKGVYAVEEFFNSDMIEANEKRDGVIIKANENVMWEARAYDLLVPDYRENIEVFNYNSEISDARSLELSTYAINLYQQFLEGQLLLEQVFDVELLAKYYAIVDIFGASHGSLYWHNFRYYLNPITMKLEPIPFDELSFEYGALKFEVGPPQFLENDGYRALYLEYLKEYMVKIPEYLIEKEDFIQDMSNILLRDGSTQGNLYPMSYQISVLEDKITEIEALR